MTHPSCSRLTRAIAATGALALGAGFLLATASPAAAAQQTVQVDFGTRTGAVLGGATGMLYGLSDDQVPSTAVVAGAAPRTVTQMPEGGLQHPNGGALTVSDTFFEAGGDDILINIQDQYPKWGYANAADPQNTYPGQADYLEKVRTVVEKVKNEADPAELDRYVFTPFNEPDWIWYGDWNATKTQFFADWSAAYDLIHSIIPGARIAGTGESQYRSDRWNDFLAYAVAHDQVPDVVTWHELDDSDLADFRGHLADYRSIENALGITDRPVNITEYGGRNDTGVPGRMIQWISLFENEKVDGNVAYWTYAGNLNDHAVQSNGGNGAWWLLKWYGDLGGDTVELTPPALNAPGTLQGVASIDDTKKLATVLLGGGGTDIDLDLSSLDLAAFGSSVDVRVERTSFSGQEGYASQPATILTQRVNLSAAGDASIVIPNQQVMDAYRVSITPSAGQLPTADAAWTAYTEAESATLSGGVASYDKSGGAQGTSGNRDVGNLGGTNAAVSWQVTVPRTGDYDLGILYGTGDKISSSDASVKTGRHALYLDGALNQIVQYESTLAYTYKGREEVPLHLTAGTHTLSLRTSADGGATALPGSNMALDRFDLREVTGPETGTYPARLARSTGAITVGGDGGVATPAGASTDFFLGADDDGYYDVTVNYRTTGATALAATLNGRAIAGLGSDAAGTWSTKATVHLARGIQQLGIAGAAGLTLESVTLTRNATADAGISTIEAESAAVTRASGVTVETPAAAYGSNVSGQFTGWLTAGKTLTIARPAGSTAGQYDVMVRYANASKFTGHPYNTDVITRTADLTEAGTANTVRGEFRHSYSYYSFWTQKVAIDLTTASAPIVFGNPTGDAPNVDSFQIARFVTAVSNTKTAPALDLTVASSTRCISGKVVLTVTATNPNAVPTAITITTAFGSKDFPAVAAGKNASAAFTTRATSIPAAAATATATATIGGQAATVTKSAPYAAASC